MLDTSKVDKWMGEIKNDVLNGGGENIDKLNCTFGKRFDSARIFDRYNLSNLNVKSLHNVSKEESKLYKYLEKEGVELYLSPSDDSEAFVCTRYGYKAIFLCPKDVEDNSKTRIVSLSHEIGHYLDLKFNFGFDAPQFTIASMNHKELIKTETIAWANARAILSAIGFEDWNMFAREMFESLNTYTNCIDDTIESISKFDELILERIYRKECGD